MSRKKTHEEYVEELKIKNPNIEVVGTYVNAHTSILHKCKIDGYEWMAKPNNILSGKGCPKCAGNIKFTHEQYVQMVSQINPYIEVIGQYINARTKILHRCLKHNIEWYTMPENILYGYGCSECLKEKIGLKNKKSLSLYIEELKIANPNIIMIGEYINATTYTTHKCLVCGYEWKTIPARLLTGQGCPKCAGNIKRTNEEYVLQVSKINPYIEVIGQYINARTPILHKCKIDGYEWNATPYNILDGKGCPLCKETSGERMVRQWLEQFNIEYEYQKVFDDCRDKKPLPFDFYLSFYNSAIEYQGGQHYFAVDFFGGKEGFERQIKHDNIKKEYCKQNNIRLLCIGYDEDINEALTNFLFI